MPSLSFTVSALAKVNLYLGVYATKDERGYHRVDSIMAAVGLGDTVTIAPAKELSVTMDPAADFPMEQNSAWRAAVELGRAYGREPLFDIHIEKHIPIRAGLGGPSTDAAAALRGLCAAWDIDIHDERVAAVARSIGADVPFFLYESPAYLSGAGDVMEETFDALEGVPVALVRASSKGVTAQEAYRVFDANPQPVTPIEPMLEALRACDEQGVVDALANNLAPAAMSIAPEIVDVLAWMREQLGVRVAEVSGSGSCCFALCESKEAAQSLANAALRERGWWSCATQMEKSGSNLIDC